MNSEIAKIFGKKKDTPQDIDFVEIALSSPEKVRSWSHGEVKKARNHKLSDI